jgi:predicted dehydrogenase
MDAVVISLPNNLHESAIAACVKAKKHVLCIRPLGRNAAKAKRMLNIVG